MGAVMAAKNLKAVAVRGRDRPEIADRSTVRELAKWGANNLEWSPVIGLSTLGTAEVIPFQNESVGFPTRNYNSGVFDDYTSISGQRMNETIVKQRTTCFACSLRCKREVEVNEGSYLVDPRYGAPEYETVSTFGSCCCINDLKAIAKANEICNRYGVDTIS